MGANVSKERIVSSTPANPIIWVKVFEPPNLQATSFVVAPVGL